MNLNESAGMYHAATLNNFSTNGQTMWTRVFRYRGVCRSKGIKTRGAQQDKGQLLSLVQLIWTLKPDRT